jgi:hypothetical protein
MTMMVFAQFPKTKWIAALLSNDGKVEGTIVRRAAPPHG